MNRGATFLSALAVAQVARAVPLAARLAAGRSRKRISRAPSAPATVSIVVPVLNEEARLDDCLAALTRQDATVAEIAVVDGGSSDATRDIAAAYARLDPRVHVVDAAPVPPGWNGKAWGLACGVRASARRFVLAVDADVHAGEGLAAALVTFIEREELDALSVATLQRAPGEAYAALHAALLATLVYRLGPPGRTARSVRSAQANGQCFFVRRDVLVRSGALHTARASRCEDVTVARALVAAGHNVGFYECDVPVTVAMYGDVRELLKCWPRSLALRDRYDDGFIGLVDVALLQVLPLTALIAMAVRPRLRTTLALGTNFALLAVRAALAAALAASYVPLRAGTALAPAADAVALLALAASALRRRHTWRGRTLVEEC